MERLLRVEEVKEIYEMKGAGASIRGIDRELDISRNTVRRYLHTPGAMVTKPRRRRASKLDPCTEYIDWRTARCYGGNYGDWATGEGTPS